MVSARAAGARSRSGRETVAPLVAIALIDLGANLQPLFHVDTAGIGMLAGLFLCLLSPALILRPALEDIVGSPARLVVAAALAVLALIVLALAINFLLPALGDSRPLAPVPATLCEDLANLIFLVFATFYTRKQGAAYAILPPTLFRPRSPLFAWCVGLTVLSVVLSIGGAVRLNNNAGDAMALVAMGLASLLVGLLVLRGSRLTEPEVGLLLFGLSAAVLLLTALRGWFVTGPDTQGEYVVFQAVSLAQHWHPTSALAAYNACLSITIFPQVLHAISGISGIFVTKAVISTLFATTPVLVFSIAARFTSRRTAIVAAAIFLTFPTFVYSLPYAARQEMGFFFLAVVVAVAPLRRTRSTSLLLYACLGGMLLSHYSTSYLFLGTIAAGYATHIVIRLAAWRPQPRSGGRSSRRVPSEAATRPTYPFGLKLIASLALGILVWNGAVNGIVGHLTEVVSGAAGVSSAGVAIPVNSEAIASQGVRVSGSVALHAFAAQQEAQDTLGVQAKRVYSQTDLHRYAAAETSILNLPFTSVGRQLYRAGISPTHLNSLIRGLVKRGLQVFAVVGTFLLLTRRRRRGEADFAAFALGCLVAVGIVFAVPALSQAYGSARAFQQALFGLAPAIAVAMRDLVRLVRRPVAVYALGTASMISVTSLTGFLPQVTGGYVAQLDFSNSGVYFAEYYTTPEELAAARWVNATDNRPVQMSRYLADRLAAVLTVPVINDDFPDRLLVNATLLFGTVTTKHQVESAYAQLFYIYPVDFVTANKSLLYASTGAQVYR